MILILLSLILTFALAVTVSSETPYQCDVDSNESCTQDDTASLLQGGLRASSLNAQARGPSTVNAQASSFGQEAVSHTGEGSCTVDDFPRDLNNQQCFGLQRQDGVSEEEACRAKCCGDLACKVYQWCPAGASNCGPAASCWTGEASSCSPGPGWISRGRSVAQISPPAPGGKATMTELFNNMVSIDVRYSTYNKLMPWQTVMGTFQPELQAMAGTSAAGIILESGLILTSAYVAVDSISITVQRQGGKRRYPASIVTIATDLDLALINVTESEFWQENDIAVEISSTGRIMGLGTPVIVPGFPTNGDLHLSQLEATASEIKAYSPGGSERYGSFPQAILTLYPKIDVDLMVGPIFSKESGNLVGFFGRNGHVIPVTTLSVFMKSYKRDKTWHGLGMLGMVLRPMTADSLRKYWNVPNDGIGVQVLSVCKDSPLHNKVKRGDILRSIDDEPIMQSGAVIYRRCENQKVMMPFQVLLGDKKPGDPTRFGILRTTPRAGSLTGNTTSGSLAPVALNVTVRLNMLKALVPRAVDETRMQQPSYFIIGGLVWTVFSEGLMNTADAFRERIPPATQAYALYRWRKDPDEEVVVLLSRLDHACNKFYGKTGDVLKYFNGKEVKNMQEFVKMAGKELQGGAKFLQFTFLRDEDEDTQGGPDDPDIVLDVDLCTGADTEILNMHQIPTPFSKNLEVGYVEAKLGKFSKWQRNHSLPKRTTNKPEPVKASLPLNATSPNATSAGVSLSALANSRKPGEVHEVPWANVVQIQAVSADQDFINPWKTLRSVGSRCSAIIVNKEKKLILTNSHCVAGSKTLDVLREDAPDPVPARVVELARDIDLAWITTDSPHFWSNPEIQPVVSMSMGLPSIASSVRVVGYPTGGSSITITQGIVSRIDGMIYPNGLQDGERNTPGNLLIVQVDAAINPGNSGGPAFDSDGNLLGLAFAALGGAENTGYVIPNLYCTNFMKAVGKEGEGRGWQAQPEVGAVFRSVQNPGMRKILKLKEHETGVQVRSVSKFSPLWSAGVRRGDVLLTIAGMQITGDGKVLRNVNSHKISMPFDTVITGTPSGDKISMHFFSPNGTDGKKYFNMTEAFHPIPPLVPRFDDAPRPVTGREHFAARPSYFMFYGLIFSVLSNPVIEQAQQRHMVIPWTVLQNSLFRWLEDEKQEVVVLLQVLEHPCNMNYDLSSVRSLSYFNGKAVKNLKELVAMASAAEAEKEEFMRFTFDPLADADVSGSDSDPDVVLHRDSCAHADQSLMASYNIKSRLSEDLKKTAMDDLPGGTALKQLRAQPMNEIREEKHVNSTGDDVNSEEHQRLQLPAVLRTVDSSSSGHSVSTEVQDGRQLFGDVQRSKYIPTAFHDEIGNVRARSFDSGEEPVPFYNGVQRDPAKIQQSWSNAKAPFITGGSFSGALASTAAAFSE